MKRVAFSLVLLFGLVGIVEAQPAPPAPKAAPKGKTGAKKTPRFAVAKAIEDGSLKVHKPVKAPAQVAWVASKTSFWLNDQDGDCVAAEGAAAIAGYSQTVTGTEYFITDATVKAFCDKYGFLNGADLLSVMQAMQSDGFHQGNDVIQEGPASVVNSADEPSLQSAVAQGQVKIGIDSTALSSAAGPPSGWSDFGGKPGQFTNEDHCIGIAAFAPGTPAGLKWLADQYGVQVPASAPALPSGCYYVIYTWNSYGFCDFAWLQSTVAEAYVRGPMLLNGKPLQPNPSPAPGAPVITSTTASAATVGVPYSFQVTATNSPTGFSILSQPPGLSIDKTSGLISGTPTTAGNYGPLVSATNASGTGMAIVAVTVGSAPVPVPGGIIITLTPDQVASVLQQSGAGGITITPNADGSITIAPIKAAKNQPKK